MSPSKFDNHIRGVSPFDVDLSRVIICVSRLRQRLIILFTMIHGYQSHIFLILLFDHPPFRINCVPLLFDYVYFKLPVISHCHPICWITYNILLCCVTITQLWPNCLLRRHIWGYCHVNSCFLCVLYGSTLIILY
jgi:hypothetical protein